MLAYGDEDEDEVTEATDVEDDVCREEDGEEELELAREEDAEVEVADEELTVDEACELLMLELDADKDPAVLLLKDDWLTEELS